MAEHARKRTTTTATATRHPRLQHHFQDMRTQQHAARLGMWLFLATEILLFGGLFCAYSYYRTLFPEAWKECSKHLNRPFGLLETFDLITSSFTMVMAIHFTRLGKKNLSVLFLLVTAAMGFGFLGLHGYEYYHEWLEGALPGKYYHFEEVTANGAPMFYAVYFLMTGLHSVHVFIGAAMLLVLAVLHGARRIRRHVRSSARPRRPLLALGRPDLDLPVPAVVLGVTRSHG